MAPDDGRLFGLADKPTNPSTKARVSDGDVISHASTSARASAVSLVMVVTLVGVHCGWVEGLQVTTRRQVRGPSDPLQFAPIFHDGTKPLSQHSAFSSPLFRQQHKSQRGNGAQSQTITSIGRRRPSTAREMVLTTPESIIEQASTQSLLDDLLDESVRTSARKPIMMQFDPSSGYIWRRWQGTVFSETWSSCVRNMVISVITISIVNALPGFRKQIDGFNVLWSQLLGVTTFTLTFFLNQSYALWRKCYELSRRLQGRLNDLGMTLASHAARTNPKETSEMSTYTPESRQLLELIGRYIRVFNLLTYASFTRSHRPVLTPRGMRRLVERNLLTKNELKALIDADIPATQRHNAVVLWIMRSFDEGRRSGLFVGGDGFEQQFLEKCHVIRAQYGAIADELQGRMPLAYAHIVQVLVDVILWLYPVMSFSVKMSPFLGVLGTGLLTMSYQGLFELAKRFLDPYDNETYGRGEDPLNIDTLIAETNSGSVRWLNSFEYMPFSADRIRNGDLKHYILPIKGSSVEELAKVEEEKGKREQEEAEEKRRQEEAKKGLEALANSTADSTLLGKNETSSMRGPFVKAKTAKASNVIVVSNETVVSSSFSNDTGTEQDPEPAAPLTLEEFSEKVQELKRAAEDELKETVAILSAPPGASSVEEIGNKESKPVKSEELEEETGSRHIEAEKEDELDKSDKFDEKPEVAVGDEIVAELEAAKEAIEEDAALVEELLGKKKRTHAE
uniref:Uncharacterized protein n=1 Tax=Grammatophora oceanica TaxID=210454 RepID=A0A6U5LRR5_9STRA|mmetsp:Transcript_34782/g.51682  ORF Transcript_34782/g.51682 Transcript_34782/m.51682 type:complete len:735 (+) Transcript_34782:31-2235(+)